jgi:hypothetical protein
MRKRSLLVLVFLVSGLLTSCSAKQQTQETLNEDDRAALSELIEEKCKQEPMLKVEVHPMMLPQKFQIHIPKSDMHQRPDNSPIITSPNALIAPLPSP